MEFYDTRLNEGKLRYEHLLGRQFVLGKTDCYEILRDIYKDNLNIELRPYARPVDFWLEKEMNLYVNNFEKEGFEYLENVKDSDLRLFDVFLIALPDYRQPKETFTNHCAIYVGNGEVVHHRLGRLSRKVNYSGMLKNFTTHTIRHKDVPEFIRKDKSEKVNLMDYILPHKRQRLLEVLNDKS